MRSSSSWCDSAWQASPLIAFRYPPIIPVGFLVSFAFLPRRQLGRVIRHSFPRDNTQQVGNAVKAGPFFVVGENHMPGSLRGVRGLEHGIARTRVVVPAAVRLEVHGA